jgi:hypothetical protein
MVRGWRLSHLILIQIQNILAKLPVLPGRLVASLQDDQVLAFADERQDAGGQIVPVSP